MDDMTPSQKWNWNISIVMNSAAPRVTVRLYIFSGLFKRMDPAPELIYFNLAKCQKAQPRNAHAEGSSGSVKTLPLIWESSRDEQVVPFALS